MRLKTIATGCLALATLLVSNQKLSALDFGGLFNNDCCCDEGSAYDEGRWSFSVAGGFTPTYFQRRGNDFVFFEGFAEPFTRRTARFRDQFDFPWTVGLELGYMYCCNWELFTDFTYTQAEGKRHSFHDFGGTVEGLLIDRHPNTFRSYEWYVGNRYYLPTMFCSFTPFVGAKVGVVYRSGISARDTFTPDVTEEVLDFQFYKSSTTVAGGFQLGVNYDISSCLQVTLKAEALWSGSLDGGHSDRRAAIDGTGPFTVIGQTGPLLYVPCTLGLRYSF